jgi:hypothetical protein
MFWSLGNQWFIRPIMGDWNPEAWSSVHRGLSTALTFQSPTDGPNSQFMTERDSVHRRALKEIQKLTEEVQANMKKAQTRLDAYMDRPVPMVTQWYFEDVEPIMLGRQSIFIQRKIHNTFVTLFSTRHQELTTLNSDLNSLRDFLSTVPQNVICRFNPKALSYQSKVPDSRHDRRLARLDPLSKRMEIGLAKLPKVLWTRDFPSFLAAVLSNCKVNSEVYYFPMDHREHSVSRYFFNTESRIRYELDAFLLSS